MNTIVCRGLCFFVLASACGMRSVCERFFKFSTSMTFSISFFPNDNEKKIIYLQKFKYFAYLKKDIEERFAVVMFIGRVLVPLPSIPPSAC